MIRPAHFVRPSLILAGLALCTTSTFAQYNERPDLVGSGSPAVDCSGRSIKNMRVRAVHTEDPRMRGGTAHLIQEDPYLAYQLGRNLNFREFRSRDGVFDLSVSSLGGPMPDGTTSKITAKNQTSCAGCHNQPNGNAGGGANFHKDSGLGRNTPHYFGAGLTEMLAIQVRADMLEQLDRNGDGWVSARESFVAAEPVSIAAAPGGALIDYGSAHLDNDWTGSPAFNNIIRVWYVDADGVHVPGATSVDAVETFGYNFDVIVYGWGQGPGRSALNPTNRAFYWDPGNAHSGLQAFDPSTANDPDGDGVSEPTLAGAIQFPATHVAPDAGMNIDPLGFSRDDPDGDGHLTEISEGDLDLAEWFMLNNPRPAFAGTPMEYVQGVQVMEKMGCTSCHTESWRIEPASAVHAGDRRLFDFDVTWNASARQLEGELVPLYSTSGSQYQPNLGAFDVVGLFSDLKHHDMGDGFKEIDFGGNMNTLWRTAPLWGVGSGFPWGHDGKSLTIEDSILRHGGEAQASRDAWENAGHGQRMKVLHLLNKLVLFDVESMPADIDGDGKISNAFHVAGQNTGLERFNAEWLFRTPLEIQGKVINSDGVDVISFAGVNINAAYGQLLPYRRDTDADGWPDMWDNAPGQAGFKDGTK